MTMTRKAALFVLLALLLSYGAVSMPTLEHKFAEVNGVKLHYVTSGNGELILFAHGFPEFWYEWKNQLADFGRDHQAVAPDLRGYNLSSKPLDVEQYQVPVLVEDLRALAVHLGTKRFTLVGHDWGGALAWAFAAAHPEMLDKLVIINAPHPGVFLRELRQNPAQQQASMYMLMFRSPGAESMLSANNYAMLDAAVLGEGLKSGYFTAADHQAYLEAWSQPGALTGGLNYYRAAHIGPPTGDAADFTASPSADVSAMSIRVPTLVIWGEKDTALLPGNLAGLDAFVPHLRIERIPEGTHWVVHEQPARVNQLIRNFLAGDTGPASTTSPLRVDHATICGSELTAMLKAFESIGLRADYGGPHASYTHMALLGFDDGSYLELIAPVKPGEPAPPTSPWGKLIAGNAGPCAWAVGPTDIHAEVERLNGAGVPASAPQHGSRKRPDGTLIEWATSAVGTASQGAVLPFMIQDRTPRALRVQPSASVKGSELTGVSAVLLGVKDLEASIALFRRAYGWPAPSIQEDSVLGARLAHFAGTPVILAAPLASGNWLSERLGRFGEAPIAFLIGSRNWETSQSRFPLGKPGQLFGRRVAWFDAGKLNGARLGIIER
jgi:pimeloyl-ACP methyl ester carboxylesterase/catechol 2,3-dioxygenase-like lactoylglutathione lyase family enzyme